MGLAFVVVGMAFGLVAATGLILSGAGIGAAFLAYVGVGSLSMCLTILSVWLRQMPMAHRADATVAAQ